MEVANMDVKSRAQRGRRETEQLRAGGQIPAVIYGRGKGNLHLAVPGQQFMHLVHTHHRLYELHLEDGGKEEAYLQDLQWDPLADEILHADFKRIDLSEKMKTSVDLHFVGQPKGLAKNGIFDTMLAVLNIECLPKDLPEEIRINVNSLDIGEAIHVRDLPLPDGVLPLDDAEVLVCHCKLRHESLAEDGDEAAEGADGPAEPEVIGKKTDDSAE